MNTILSKARKCDKRGSMQSEQPRKALRVYNLIPKDSAHEHRNLRRAAVRHAQSQRHLLPTRVFDVSRDLSYSPQCISSSCTGGRNSNRMQFHASSETQASFAERASVRHTEASWESRSCVNSFWHETRYRTDFPPVLHHRPERGDKST